MAIRKNKKKKSNHIAYSFFRIANLSTDLIWGLLWFSIIFIIVTILDYFNFNIKNNIAASIVGGAILAGLLFFNDTFRLRFKRYIIFKFFPINKEFTSEDCIKFEEFFRAIKSRVWRVIPDEFKKTWNDEELIKKNRFMIPLNAEEVISNKKFYVSTGKIKNALNFFNDELFKDLNSRLPPFVIQGEPGSGKSTLIFELFRKYLGRLKSNFHSWIPLLIFAYDISWEMLEGKNSLRDFLTEYYQKCGEVYKKDEHCYNEIARFIENDYGRFQYLIIIDGLDEITYRSHYNKITKKINELLESEWKKKKQVSRPNRYILSCRTEDNQHNITGRLISLFHLEYEVVLKHLKSIRKYYKKFFKNDKKVEIINKTLNGLKRSKENRLLQNYISNPYLLSLIIEYFGENEKLVKSLDIIFKQVLERELNKPQKDFEKVNLQYVRGKNAGYISSLLGPYCFLNIMDSLVEKQQTKDSKKMGSIGFLRYIEKDEKTSKILFGEDGKMGYFEAFFRNNSGYREIGYNSLANIWGSENTERFRNTLELIKSEIRNLDQLIYKGIDYLYNDIFEMLEKYNIAEIESDGSSIKRFRHRRMQDYFMACFVEKVGVEINSDLYIQMGNAWMREPLRIIAAVSSNPGILCNAFLHRFDHLKQSDINIDDKWDKMSNLLLNASEAVAYIPYSEELMDNEFIYSSVVKLGIKAEDFLLQTMHKSKKRKINTQLGWLLLQEKCLRILRNIYASEFLKSKKDLFKGNVWRSRWKKIHELIQFKAHSFHHLAYTHLYPIKANHKRFPIKRISLFFYIWDAILFFPDAYERIVSISHKKISNRIIIKFLARIQNALSISIWGLFIFYVIWRPHDTSETVLFKVSRTLSSLGIITIFAFILQIMQLMQWKQFHNFIPWIFVKFLKKSGVILKRFIKIIPELLKYLYSLLSKEFIHKAMFKVFCFFKKLIYSKEFILMMMLKFVNFFEKLIHVVAKYKRAIIIFVFVGFLLYFSIPPLENLWKNFELSTNINKLLKKTTKVQNAYTAYLKKHKQIMNPNIEYTSFAIINQTINRLDGMEKEMKKIKEENLNLTKFFNEGRDSKNQDHNYIKIVENKQRVKEIIDEITKRKDELEKLRFDLRVHRFLSNARYIQIYAKFLSWYSDSFSLKYEIDKILAEGYFVQSEEILEESVALRALHNFDQSKQKKEIIALAQEIRTYKSDLESKLNLKWQNSVKRFQKILEENEYRDLINANSELTRFFNSLSPNIDKIENTIQSLANSSLRKIYSKEDEIKECINYLKELEKFNKNLSTIRHTAYKLKMRNILSEIKEIKSQNEKELLIAKIEIQILKITKMQKNLSDYRNAIEQIKIESLRKALNKLVLKVHEFKRRVIVFLVFVLVILSIISILIFLVRRYGDLRGNKELAQVKYDFDKLLSFIKNNGYSWNVNEEAIDSLRQIAPTETKTIKKISDVAEIRHNRPGELNEKVSQRLIKVAIGIDNKLNR